MDREDNGGGRRVRFPANNNPRSRRSYYPDEEEGLENNGRTPPIAEEEEEPGDYFSIPMQERSRQGSSPMLYVTRPEESTSVNLSRRSSESSGFKTPYDSTRNLIPRMNQPIMVNNDMAGILDVGMYTSGGLAPGGATHQSTEEGYEVDPERDLERRRIHLLQGLEQMNREQDEQLAAALAAEERSSSNLLNPEGGEEEVVEAEENIALRDLSMKANEEELAKKLVRSHTLQNSNFTSRASEREFDEDERDETSETARHEDYVPQGNVKQGILSSLLKLYENEDMTESRRTSTTGTLVSGIQSPSEVGSPIGSEGPSPSTSRRNSLGDLTEKPKKQKWYKQHKRNISSSHSLSNMVLSATSTLTAPASADNLSTATDKHYHHGQVRPRFAKRHSAANLLRRKQQKMREEKTKITVHIAGVLQRQRFILRICRALMLYGAPTHRLEEYLKMTSRVLEINGQFLYIPGCMIVSFDDAMTHTSEMRLVRVVQGLNLSKLHETHQIYKLVVHDMVGVEEASKMVDELLARKNRYPDWLCVVFFGLASAFVTPWAFGGTWQDLPICFLLGGAVGVLQVMVAPKSDLYSNVFEVTSSIVVSFLGRAIGSIYKDGKPVFCFAGIAQGSLALILPGYIILCGSLELQSKNIVSGSVRMFYAIIYSLFLGFGITMGATIYGWIDSNATSQTYCSDPINPWYYFLFIPGFAISIAQVNQANIRQLPVMVLIASAGYAVTYFVKLRVSGSSDFVSAIGAFVIGILGNLYSRLGHGLAFAAMLPAIFAQVPNGVASQGSLVAGVQNADQIVSNGTKPLVSYLPGGGRVTYTPTAMPNAANGGAFTSSNAMNLGLTMVQVCIGITVGLFVATLVIYSIYPVGRRKRSGLFTF